MDKRETRRRIFALRDRLDSREIEQKSARIAARLYRLSAYRQARVIMFFLSFRSEVATRAMVEESMARGKRVLVPKAVPETRELIPSVMHDWELDLAPGAYGIPEPRPEALRPVDPAQIDLLIVPGVAFDRQGNRLGYGGGYYDRFFSLLQVDVLLVALAFELQIIDEVPVSEWDHPVDWIITEDRAICTKRIGR